ncbi:hypothetical protein CTI12_AA587480 [Artemisia annua]|uniref:Uncharacterized protein n=1 Tax=Artemisia annua TaxID=35608 RepID=A0A2U1KFT6_ARTAN|nr:hypothetical protein CTI12_AA587480 [Artemisia annua]
MGNFLIELALRVVRALLVEFAAVLLEKGEALLAKSTPRVVRFILAELLILLAEQAKRLSEMARKHYEKTGSLVGMEVAKAAEAIAAKLDEMARKLRDDPTSMVQMEEATHDAEVLALTYGVDAGSLKRWIKEVEHLVEEVARLLKEDAELKGGEAGDNHPHWGDEQKVTN